MQARMAYFYGPYNSQYEVNKHMNFEEPERDQRWTQFCEHIVTMEPNQMKLFRKSLGLFNASPRKAILAKIRETARKTDTLKTGP
jgi:hypothetical protein